MGRKSKAKERRLEILSHFYEVIIEEGFEGASIAKIAEKMSVNPSLLIHYYKTKDAMIEGLIEHIINTYSSHILPDFSKVEDPKERWEDVLDVVSRIQWGTFLNTTVFYSAYTLSLRDPGVKNKFTELYEKVVGQLQDEIAHAQQANIFQVKDTRQAAQLVMTLIEGANFYQNVSHNGVDIEKRSRMIKETITLMTDNNI